MPRGGLQLWHLGVIVLLAAMLGTALSDLIGKAFPDGGLTRLLSAGVTVGTSSPWDLDLRVITVTLGIVLRLTVLGAAAAGAALFVFFRRL